LGNRENFVETEWHLLRPRPCARSFSVCTKVLVKLTHGEPKCGTKEVPESNLKGRRGCRKAKDIFKRRKVAL